MPGERHLLKPEDAAAVAEFSGKVRGALGSEVLEMRLFGSKATGRDDPESDIDVLVVVQEARTEIEDRILAIAFDVNLTCDVFISPTVVARSTLDDPVWGITPFLKAALAGVPTGGGTAKRVPGATRVFRPDPPTERRTGAATPRSSRGRPRDWRCLLVGVSQAIPLDLDDVQMAQRRVGLLRGPEPAGGGPTRELDGSYRGD